MKANLGARGKTPLVCSAYPQEGVREFKGSHLIRDRKAGEGGINSSLLASWFKEKRDRNIWLLNSETGGRRGFKVEKRNQQRLIAGEGIAFRMSRSDVLLPRNRKTQLRSIQGDRKGKKKNAKQRRKLYSFWSLGDGGGGGGGSGKSNGGYAGRDKRSSEFGRNLSPKRGGGKRRKKAHEVCLIYFIREDYQSINAWN